MKDNRGKTLALLKTGLFTVIVPGTVAFYIPVALALPERQWTGLPAAAWQYLGLPFLLSGTAIFASERLFRYFVGVRLAVYFSRFLTRSRTCGECLGRSTRTTAVA
jgi:hypothetical protein